MHSRLKLWTRLKVHTCSSKHFSNCSQATKLEIKKLFVFVFVSDEARWLTVVPFQNHFDFVEKMDRNHKLGLEAREAGFLSRPNRLGSLKLITCCIFNKARTET